MKYSQFRINIKNNYISPFSVPTWQTLFLSVFIFYIYHKYKYVCCLLVCVCEIECVCTRLLCSFYFLNDRLFSLSSLWQGYLYLCIYIIYVFMYYNNNVYIPKWYTYSSCRSSDALRSLSEGNCQNTYKVYIQHNTTAFSSPYILNKIEKNRLKTIFNEIILRVLLELNRYIVHMNKNVLLHYELKY